MKRKPELDKLLDSDYDGIQEYDNPMPRWWVAIFWATVIFSLLYIPFYHYGPGLLARDEYEQDMLAFYDQQAKELLALGEITDEIVLTMASNPTAMDGAEKIYKSKCATCHGIFGEGLIGPNLTDEYWIHGGGALDVYNTVRYGVVEKGMLAWEKQLPPGDVIGVSAYVLTLVGTDPPNAKKAEGDLYVAPEAGAGENETEGDSGEAPAEEAAGA